MLSFDVIVIGSGAGFIVVDNALAKGKRVALVEKGPLGGTCLNNGCIPSKILITPADIIRSFQDAKAIGVEGEVTKVDFPSILGRFRALQEDEHKHMLEEIKASKNLSFYPVVGEFIGDYTLKVGEETIMAPKIVIASGSRPAVPPIPGLKETGYIDNITLLDLKKLPESLAIIGAGYIGCEYGHFFSAMGTKVTLIGRPPVVLDNEDPEVSAAITKALPRYMDLMVGHEVTRVEKSGNKKAVIARSMKDGKEVRIEAEEVMLAGGRRSNSDLLKPEKSGVATDKKGFIIVNEHLETNKPGIYAFGDAIGRYMFRHTANYEADVVSINLLSLLKTAVDFHAVPNAVFTHPQAAHVGMKEAEAVAAGKKILVGRARYTDTAKGYALNAQDGFVKVVTEEGTGKILGCSVVGEFAPEIVQQVVWLMNTREQDYTPVVRGQIIHPAISEVLGRAFGNLEHPEHHHNTN
ncbi:putative FAD-dependent pyridine nucleotide-disulphide oxidoreductase [Methanocella paludicola SANAE]|uniref:FAD-dependent pyridine nucleotide-disulphide oxidoreductase n=1 Tax=Methanocella paludicola (strain DSM 17711 / JCM 13418 / NBRC 101707 / SANAE) TaxID=304371 RepID=D1YX70_METPS|nr:dihydrolipoyl dehydrogenase [Methanocella paludicola]BAI61042.1 putative FAD-dependent pyridine nucleotide-disulphide oxidoreductase [Methanocella paludicola SANAE]